MRNRINDKLIRFFYFMPEKYKQCVMKKTGEGMNDKEAKAHCAKEYFKETGMSVKDAENYVSQFADNIDQVIEFHEKETHGKEISFIGKLVNTILGIKTKEPENKVIQYSDCITYDENSKELLVKIAEAGKYPEGDVSESDLQVFVDNSISYSRNGDTEIPFTLGHPKKDPDTGRYIEEPDKIHGWIKPMTLKKEGTSVYARVHNLTNDMKRWIEEKRVRYISPGVASFSKRFHHAAGLSIDSPAMHGMEIKSYSENHPIICYMSEGDSMTPEEKKKIEKEAAEKAVSEYKATQERQSNQSAIAEYCKGKKESGCLTIPMKNMLEAILYRSSSIQEVTEFVDIEPKITEYVNQKVEAGAKKEIIQPIAEIMYGKKPLFASIQEFVNLIPKNALIPFGKTEMEGELEKVHEYADMIEAGYQTAIPNKNTSPESKALFDKVVAEFRKRNLKPSEYKANWNNVVEFVSKGA